MFLFKKIVAPFFFPLSCCLEILIIGLILLWFSKYKKAGKIIISAGVISLTLLSYPALPEMLLQPLEYKYPPLLSVENLPKVRWILVRGGHTSNPQLPINSQLSETALSCLVEAVRIHKSLPGSRIILSGGARYNPVPDVEIMRDVALALGIERQDLILESPSDDTDEEAKFTRAIVGNEPFILVHVAVHMPRSIAIFRKLGMQPIPAPTYYRVIEKHTREINPYTFFPLADNLKNAEIAIYEYMGLAWGKLRGRM